MSEAISAPERFVASPGSRPGVPTGPGPTHTVAVAPETIDPAGPPRLRFPSGRRRKPGAPAKPMRRPPRHVPRQAVPRPPLSRGQLLLQSSLGLVAVVLFGFLLNLVVLSQLQHVIAQQQLRAQLAEQLAAGAAPVSEGDYDNVLLSDGDPVARIEIPAIGVDEVVVEGTSSGVLTGGPGHRRDTVLPGQLGVSVLMGRAAAYGGPFGRIQELPPGETISVITGQGEHIYRVLGVRYAGDPSVAYTPGTSRLILETARGGPFMPTGVVRVDAELVSEVKPSGARQTTYATLPPPHRELASDFSTAWALVFALQFLVLAEVAAVYSRRRFGGAKTWVVFVPVLLLSGLLAADQLTRLLPNLL